jgi:hypothetical protein
MEEVAVLDAVAGFPLDIVYEAAVGEEEACEFILICGHGGTTNVFGAESLEDFLELFQAHCEFCVSDIFLVVTRVEEFQEEVAEVEVGVYVGFDNLTNMIISYSEILDYFLRGITAENGGKGGKEAAS